MNEAAHIIVLTFAAGLCMPLGGVIARFEHISPKWLETEVRHFAIAFGGGLLLGAVLLVLLPEGMARFGASYGAVLVFVAGGFMFFAIERSMGLRRRESPQLISMIIDYIPESIALGGLVAADPQLALVLAVVIGAQNLPEGFNTYRELVSSPAANSRDVLLFMLLLTPIGPAAGLSAHFLLDDSPRLLGAIMLIAAGGILYLMFQDIAPQSRLRRHWAPPLGAVAGFAITMLTDIWLGHALKG
ncbi:MAG: divalent cation transporter [Gammaproteobacteria bacterium]|nr:divalent cation transporter [Gammaproteobacteria bacterium]